MPPMSTKCDAARRCPAVRLPAGVAACVHWAKPIPTHTSLGPCCNSFRVTGVAGSAVKTGRKALLAFGRPRGLAPPQPFPYQRRTMQPRDCGVYVVRGITAPRKALTDLFRCLALSSPSGPARAIGQACWNKIPNAGSCPGDVCTVPGQYCPPDRQGSSGVRQIRRHFGPILRAVLSSTPPVTRRVACPTWCPCCSGADWCLESDDVTNLGLQAGYCCVGTKWTVGVCNGTNPHPTP